MLDLAAVGESIDPARPRIDVELANADGTVLAYEVRRITLRCQRDIMPAGFDPRLKSVDQHHPSGRRSCRDEKDRLIAAGANSGDGAGCESAEPIGLQPLSRIVRHVGCYLSR